MKELIVIRHGEADHLVQSLTGGWSSSNLTELGKHQAAMTGQKLVSLIDNRKCQFFSSDLVRASETADIIATHIRLQPVLTPLLRELNNGAGADKTLEDAAKIAIPMSDPLVDWTPYPDAESWRAMSNRVCSFMDSLDKTKELTILVLHAGSGNAAIFWWLEIGIGKHNIAFEMEPCSICRFAINKWGEKTIIKLNDTGHLDL